MKKCWTDTHGSGVTLGNTVRGRSQAQKVPCTVSNLQEVTVAGESWLALETVGPWSAGWEVPGVLTARSGFGQQKRRQVTL